MKYIYLFLTLFSTSGLIAQTGIMPDTLSVFKSVQYKERIEFEDYAIEFKNLISDSRCPKDVMCVRAGEAKLLVELYKNNEFIKETQLIIHASGYVSETNNLIAEFEDYSIYGTMLSPYPKSTERIKEKDYRLMVMFRPKQRTDN